MEKEKYKIEKDFKIIPYSFQLEMIQGCSRRCDFCGLNQIRGKKRVFNEMSIELAEIIAPQIGKDFKEKIRIEFGMHGEPLFNRNADIIISIFRKHLPKSQISLISNGDPIKLKGGDEKIKSLFDSGLNNLMIDIYDGRENSKSLLENVKKSDITIKDFYKDNYSIWGYKSNTSKNIVLVDDIATLSGQTKTREIHTAGGNLPKEVWGKYGIKDSDLPKKTRCGKPFREFAINYDGNVNICCEDWQRKNVIGNAYKTKLIDIWEDKKFQEYRFLLINKRRDLIGVCSKCNEKSFRTGFLKINEEFPNLLTEIKTNQQKLDI